MLVFGVEKLISNRLFWKKEVSFQNQLKKIKNKQFDERKTLLVMSFMYMYKKYQILWRFMNNRVFLNEKIAKKLIKNEKYGKALSAKVISEVLKADYNEVYNNIKISTDEIAFSALTVNSTADAIYYDDYMYINIEFNFYGGESKKKQLESYMFQLYLGQLHTYENYHDIKKILQISIDSYSAFSFNEFIYSIKLMEEKHHVVYDDSIHFVHINLDYLRKIDYNEIIKDELMKTLYFLICDDEEKITKLYGDDDLMEKIVKEAKQIAGTQKMHLYLTDEEMRKQDQDFYYQKGVDDGIEQGILSNQRKIVLNMFKKKFTCDVISEVVGIPISEVRQIVLENDKV